MRKTNASVRLWDYCWKYVSDTRSLTATSHPVLDERTPFELVHGYTPNISEYRFLQKTQSNNNWTNINTVGNGWEFSNPIIFGPIIETTEFRVKIREESGCKASSWGGPTNQGAIVPINNMNNLLIYHN